MKNYLKWNYDVLVLKCVFIFKFKIEEQHSNHSTHKLQLTEVFCVDKREWFFSRLHFISVVFFQQILSHIKGNQGHFSYHSKSEWCKLNSLIAPKHLFNEIIWIHNELFCDLISNDIRILIAQHNINVFDSMMRMEIMMIWPWNPYSWDIEIFAGKNI